MPRKPKIPEVIYHQVGEDQAAIDAVFDVLFSKFFEQKAAEKQATQARKNDKSPGKSET